MFRINNINGLLFQSVDMFFKLMYMMLWVRVLLSWVPSSKNSSIGKMIYTITEPILGPIKEALDKSPLGGGTMIDFSPIIAVFVLGMVETILKGLF